MNRPVTSYGALDLPTYFLDLTPFIPVLTDGSPHNITLDVVSAESNHAINSNWYVSGLLQIELGSTNTSTTGNITKYEVGDYAQTTSGGNVSESGDLTVTVGATRSVRIESEIWTGSGDKVEVVFEQELQFENVQSYVNDASIQVRRLVFPTSQCAMVVKWRGFCTDCDTDEQRVHLVDA